MRFAYENKLYPLMTRPETSSNMHHDYDVDIWLSGIKGLDEIHLHDLEGNQNERIEFISDE
jgi:hypothetical protein